MNQILERILYLEDEPLNGTIIDLETIGPIDDESKGTKRYTKVKPYIFGYLTENMLAQKYVEHPDRIPELIRFIKKIDFSDAFRRPLYAFFTEFESGVIYCSTGKKILFDGELKCGSGGKESAVRKLGIKSYEDPFPGAGLRCIEEFKKGDIAVCLNHNRASLLKERDILFSRGFVEPAKIEFHDMD
jgi:hypothetical protein